MPIKMHNAEAIIIAIIILRGASLVLIPLS